MSDLAIPAAVSRRAWLDEARATLALAWPIILTNLLQIALTTTDVIMMGRLGPDALAAGVLGANLFFAFVIAGIRPRHRRGADGGEASAARGLTRCARCAARCARGCGARSPSSIPVWIDPLVRRADPARARPGSGHGRRIGALSVDAAMGVPAVHWLHRAAEFHRRGGAAALGAMGRASSASSSTRSPRGA